jgi:hypothetical protein
MEHIKLTTIFGPEYHGLYFAVLCSYAAVTKATEAAVCGLRDLYMRIEEAASSETFYQDFFFSFFHFTDMGLIT